MRKSYDFSEAQPNPYAKRLKKQVTLHLSFQTLEYFEEAGVSCRAGFLPGAAPAQAGARSPRPRRRRSGR